MRVAMRAASSAVAARDTIVTSNHSCRTRRSLRWVATNVESAESVTASSRPTRYVRDLHLNARRHRHNGVEKISASPRPYGIPCGPDARM